ncbi:glycosyltransferase family 1 protein [Vibrio sp. 506]|uniref:glycosyltransferase family 4 protein n=1 Tax=Vibrio sp. 506 TaxID=3074607 RepID=UPI00296492E0|nr:glycosyltransferase family 1 protein [Vibrio sp. 506]MDW2056807.1 glycosyltransferase family 1 protein [Vibrio sp. 506]
MAKLIDSNKLYINGRFLSQRFTGVQKFALQQIVDISDKYDVCVLVPKNADVSVLPENINYRRVGLNSGHLWEQFDLRLFLLMRKSPLLLTLSGLPPILYKNSIFTIHDLSFKHEPSWFSFGYRVWYGFAYEIVTRYCLRIITVSNFSKNELLNYYPSSKDKISVVYNKVPSFNSVTDNNQDTKSKFILLVSSLDPRKNIKSFINAFVSSENTDYKLLIAGGSGSAFKFEYPSHVYPNVEFLGYVDDDKLAELYSSATLFAYPSLYEGFGIPPLEAMSNGCPCVVSDVSSIPEVCGDAAYYFDPGSAESIKNAINEVIGSDKLKDELVRKGFTRLEFLNNNPNDYTIERALNESFAVK